MLTAEQIVYSKYFKPSLVGLVFYFIFTFRKACISNCLSASDFLFSLVGTAVMFRAVEYIRDQTYFKLSDTSANLRALKEALPYAVLITLLSVEGAFVRVESLSKTIVPNISFFDKIKAENLGVTLSCPKTLSIVIQTVVVSLSGMLLFHIKTVLKPTP